MALFGKKKKVEAPVVKYDFTLWEKDFGFLALIMERKKKITKEFLLNPASGQLSDKDYLRDEDIEPIVDRSVKETLSSLGDPYKNFLIEKYFGSLKNLTEFIVEDFYVDLVTDTINRNSAKMKKGLQNKAVEIINSFNKDK